MDTLGFEPRAFHMRSGCDTTTPCALEKKRRKTPVFALLCYSRLGSSDRHWGVPIHVLATLQGVCWLAKITKRIGSCTCARCKRAKCQDPGSNRGPSDLQSDALPTELSRLLDVFHGGAWPGSPRHLPFWMGLVVTPAGGVGMQRSCNLVVFAMVL